MITWEEDRSKIGWDILFLVGTASSLGMALWENGTATWIANACLGGLNALPLTVVIALVSLFTILIHLVIPVNTPIVTVVLPPVVAIAVSMGINPRYFGRSSGLQRISGGSASSGRGISGHLSGRVLQDV